MKNLLLSALLVMITQFVHAQSSYDKTHQYLHVGLGLVPTITVGKSTIPPLSLSYEKGITENLGIGAYLGYASSKEEFDGFLGDYTFKTNYLIIGGRGLYHYPLFKNDKIDTYGGLMLGYNIVNLKVKSDSDDDLLDDFVGDSAASRIAYAFFVGARYHISDSFTAFAELGYGVSVLTFGVSWAL